MTKRITIDLDEETLAQMDEERKKKKFSNLSRSQLIDYLLNKWFKDDCKVIMED